MNSDKAAIPIIIRITNHLPTVEKIFLATLFGGTILSLLKIDTMVIRIAFLGLGIA